jgi:hypothetical protein
VTFLAPEDQSMLIAAQLAHVPRSAFPQVKGTVEPIAQMPSIPSASDRTPGRPTMLCRCGCGEPVTQARIGRPSLYASGACRMRALRSRRRGPAGS